MVMINRGSIQANCTDLMDLKQPIQNAQNFIQPVIEVGPKVSNVIKSTSGTTSGNITIYTTPSDKDFYLTYAQLTYTKDATSDCTTVGIAVVINGATIRVVAIESQTTTAGSFSQGLAFSYPLKVDRGSGILIVGTHTAGSITKRANIGGYILE